MANRPYGDVLKIGGINKMGNMKRFLFFCLLTILTACGSQVDITATEVRIEAKAPTTTYSPIPSPSKTQTPTNTLTPSATYTERPTATLLYLTPPPANAPTADVKIWTYYGLTSTSPDGQWVADTWLHKLNIYHHTGWLLWELTYQTAYGETWWGNYIRVFDWSYDSRYLYFSPYWPCTGCNIRRLGKTIGLWRLDITSGEVKEEILMIPEEKDTTSMSIALLIDKNLLAYVKFSSRSMPVDLIIRYLDTGEEIIRYPIGDEAFIVGSLTWSPNGKKIFYVEVAVDEYDENNWPEVFRYLLMMIDVNTGEKTLLLDMGDPGYYVYQSEEGNIIKLEKAGYPKACEIYNFDIYKKEFVGFVTVTPDPKAAGTSSYYCRTSTPTPTP